MKKLFVIEDTNPEATSFYMNLIYTAFKEGKYEVKLYERNK